MPMLGGGIAFLAILEIIASIIFVVVFCWWLLSLAKIQNLPVRRGHEQAPPTPSATTQPTLPDGSNPSGSLQPSAAASARVLAPDGIAKRYVAALSGVLCTILIGLVLLTEAKSNISVGMVLFSAVLSGAPITIVLLLMVPRLSSKWIVAFAACAYPLPVVLWGAYWSSQISPAPTFPAARINPGLLESTWMSGLASLVIAAIIPTVLGPGRPPTLPRPPAESATKAD